MKFVNLTPHPIRVLDVHGAEHEFVPSGQVARVGQVTHEMPELSGFRVRTNQSGTISGLPEPQDVVIYLVSGFVLAACRGREDVLAPDTGPDCLRDENGHITAVRGFLRRGQRSS